MDTALFAKWRRDGGTTHAAIALLAIAAMFAPAAGAQSYPNKPVKLEVGAPAGGGTDIVARMLGDKLGESMKQSFVVDNRPGASNTIAADFTAKSTPDGYTLLVATTTSQAIAPHLTKLNFDTLNGQIAMKLMGLERGVTVQGGLPVAITTPAHGMAYEIAGRGIANTQAMQNALAIAARMGAAAH